LVVEPVKLTSGVLTLIQNLVNWSVSDCIKMKIAIINDFKKQFELRSDIGREYFEGDSMLMMKIINKYVEEDIKNMF